MYHIEKLFHFECKCGGWFTIADADKDRNYYCPWCGIKEKHEQIIYEDER